MRFLSKLSLFLIVLTVPSLMPPITKSVFCPLAAWAWDSSDFGRDGQQGTDGRAGREGRSGQSQTIFVEGSSANLDLSGRDGEDGADGSNGENAYCRHQPQDVDHDLHAADGGRGGDGGNGGEGGDGGSLTVYYSNLADVRKISVRSEGGEGGRGGRGAYGGHGCNCDRRRWERKTCTGTPGSPDYKCKTQKFSCTDGRDGSSGSNGSDGRKGRLGTLTLINRKEPLPADTPTTTLSISELRDKVVTLSKNKWNTRTGAASLLAAGSVIADEYREFVERIEGSFQLVWNETQPISSFGDQSATITLNEDKQVKVDFPEEVWIDSTRSQQAGLTQLVVDHAIRQSDVTKLKVANFADRGANLNLQLVDLGGRADLLATQFWLKYRTTSDAPFTKFSNYETRYEGAIPASLVTRDKNRFILALGKLPVASNFLQSGTDVEIELIATRTFAGRSKEQKINWQGKVRNSP
jgi:hypothetical protein